MTQQTTEKLPEPIRDGLGGTILGPRNVPLERENPDLLAWQRPHQLHRPGGPQLHRRRERR
jgi:hypothetical protein